MLQLDYLGSGVSLSCPAWSLLVYRLNSLFLPRAVTLATQLGDPQVHQMSASQVLSGAIELPAVPLARQRGSLL